MLKAKLLAQKLSHNPVTQRRRFKKSARYALPNINIGKAAMTDHDGANSVVLALEEFYVRRKVLSNQVVMRKTDDRHLFVRINFACANAWKMFQTSQQPCALHSAQVDHSVAQNFAGRASPRTRVKPVGEKIALVRHD